MGHWTSLWNRIGARASRPTVEAALSETPLILAPGTYNTCHPDYDARVVRNHVGRIFPGTAPANSVFREISALGENDTVDQNRWRPILDEATREIEDLPGGRRLFARRLEVERDLEHAGARFGAHYVPGWVNVDDGLFLYWLVRRLKPRTIVQTGVCNGVSSACMTLALAANGGPGSLHAIDMPNVLDPDNPAWRTPGHVYGATIAPGRSSGWLVPESCQDRFHVQLGDAADLLPGLVASLDGVDLFFHDSDHTYNHMMFEFQQVRPALRPGGLIVADDIAWNASLWDAAESWGVPAYNFGGSMGVAFF